MTPEALAKQTALSNRALVESVSRLADLVGGAEAEVAELRAIKPSARRPAESMLRERQALVKITDALCARITAAIDNAAQASEEEPVIVTSQLDVPPAKPARGPRRNKIAEEPDGSS